MMQRFAAIILITLSTVANTFAHDPEAQATYLGNEGVMVTRGGVKILILRRFI